MNLFLNIILGILLIVLGVFPNLFVVVNANQREWYNRLTTSGYILVVIMVIVIIITTINEIRKENESEITQQSLKDINESLTKDNKHNATMLEDIQNALRASKLEYDPREKAIINNNVTANPSGNMLSVVSGGQSRVTGIDMKRNTMTTTMVMEYHEFMGVLTQAKIKYNIKGKQVYLGSFIGTAGRQYMPQIEKVLLDNGYKIIDKVYDVKPYMDHDTNGAKVGLRNGELFVIVGNLT